MKLPTKKDYVGENLLLRVTLAIILLSHSVPGMIDGGVNAFGKLYLNEIGFDPFGVWLAWALKISHVICALALILNRFVVVASLVFILILIEGIIFIHFKEGWFVVGGGRNGMEYNVLLIAVLSHLVIWKLQKKRGA